ncbi:SusD/RagB family nutrient-binding outer membrane lipoprotein [Marinilongibacter aquaticus]|uniref:SusD/RagB family nutrient-binding outer membrane lipoprotein n=1 Tax=Marinilongibacter aquaticus TaxID=2975157 RepID=UPI0021BD6A7E|nr:SusD/RagB family nutrient-binding outer membrane lipoprotein [Marinilongibacter aquaticus]UBM57183.1 SusD/RagB family nutrient-binding outer membrane lipoprotein [Marinilongibacter aquaticus]
MKNIRKIGYTLLFMGMALSLQFCKDLSEVNVNPNEVTLEKANANLIMSTVLTQTAKAYNELGYGDAAGVVQHTQKDAWFDGHNNYDWGPRDWGSYYDILRDNQAVYEKAVQEDLQFHMGVSLVMRAFLFAQIADLWGDAPYTQALKGNLGGVDNLLPSYDSQEAIYKGVIADLKEASGIFAQSSDAFKEVLADADVYYGGDTKKWQKFANSLLLRYLMRVSEKMDVQSDFVSVAQSGAIITSNGDNALLHYLGNTTEDAWPANNVFDASGSNFRRIRPARTLIEVLRAREDPRMAVWFAKVEIPTQFSTTIPHNSEIDGIRYFNPDSVDTGAVNTNLDYVGLPTQMSLPSGYNYNPTPGQTSNNKYVSYLNDIYREANGPLLNARLMTATEVNFLLAEAAWKGWLSDAEGYYNKAIMASLEEWGVEEASTYLVQDMVEFDGSLEQIMQQKWIASWTAAQEAWFDYRRTALPELETGQYAPRPVLPLRFIYGSNELNFNPNNAQTAIDRLEATTFSQSEKNSSWSKTWLIAGTGKPF